MAIDSRKELNTDLTRRVEAVVEQLREHGYRVTPQRMAIVQMVLGSASHPSAEDVYEQVSAQLPMLSLATVYKTLNTLKELDIVTELELGGSRHYDGAPHPHPHLICVQCHKIIDLPPDTMSTPPEDVLDKTGFRIHRYELNIYGLCSRCQAGSDET